MITFVFLDLVASAFAIWLASHWMPKDIAKIVSVPQAFLVRRNIGLSNMRMQYLIFCAYHINKFNIFIHASTLAIDFILWCYLAAYYTGDIFLSSTNFVNFGILAIATVCLLQFVILFPHLLSSSLSRNFFFLLFVCFYYSAAFIFATSATNENGIVKLTISEIINQISSASASSSSSSSSNNTRLVMMILSINAVLRVLGHAVERKNCPPFSFSGSDKSDVKFGDAFNLEERGVAILPVITGTVIAFSAEFMSGIPGRLAFYVLLNVFTSLFCKDDDSLVIFGLDVTNIRREALSFYNKGLAHFTTAAKNSDSNSSLKQKNEMSFFELASAENSKSGDNNTSNNTDRDANEVQRHYAKKDPIPSNWKIFFAGELVAAFLDLAFWVWMSTSTNSNLKKETEANFLHLITLLSNDFFQYLDSFFANVIIRISNYVNLNLKNAVVVNDFIFVNQSFHIFNHSDDSNQHQHSNFDLNVDEPVMNSLYSLIEFSVTICVCIYFTIGLIRVIFNSSIAKATPYHFVALNSQIVLVVLACSWWNSNSHQIQTFNQLSSNSSAVYTILAIHLFIVLFWINIRMIFLTSIAGIDANLFTFSFK